MEAQPCSLVDAAGQGREDCYSDGKALSKSSESAVLNVFCQRCGLSLQDTAVFPSLSTSNFVKLSICSPWAETLWVESAHTPSGGSGRNPSTQWERYQAAPHPWSLLPCPAQEPFCHSCGTGVLRPQHIPSKIIQIFIAL